MVVTRVLAGTGATIGVTFQVQGTATNPSPDTATVEVVRADGTVLIAAGTATDDTGTGSFTYQLTPANTATLDNLRARWTAAVGGVAQTLETRVEIVGGFLFSLAELAAMPGMSGKTPAAMAEARTLAEDALEHACGVAFVPRYARETFTGYGDTTLGLNHPRVRTVRAVTVDGTAYTAGELANVRVHSSRFLYNPLRWNTTVSDTVIAYEHGYDYPPPRVGRAARLLARSWLIQGPVDDRTTAFSTVEGGTFSIMTPGLRGALFELPEVEAVVQDYGAPRYLGV